MFDAIIIGAGFAGCVLAERLATQKKKKVLLIEKRNHIGGNCFDYTNEFGITVHRYGPHLFHTEFREVFEYLSQFTDWQLYEHRVLAKIDGQKVPLPFNFNSMDMLFGAEFSNLLQKKLLTYYPYGSKVPILELKKIKDPDILFLSDFVYKKVFLNYTAKQWGKKPEEIDPAVTARVPVLLSRDNRYFQDPYQAIPKEGYTKIFEKMLDNPNIKILLNTSYQEIMHFDHKNKKIFFMSEEWKKPIIFTGMIDELFHYEFGVLPYRSLRFHFQTIDQKFFQEVATVNYPNDHLFTRITEFKHIHAVENNKTTVVYEYPKEYQKGEIPYYPVFTEEAQKSYEKYKEKAKETFPNLILVGRLADYRYYDMDDTVKRALEVYGEFFD